MPTARELLEEADALMRRNRSLQADDIPLLTDSVPVPTEAQVLRGRGAASRGGIPVAPPARAEPPVGDEYDSIPTLTEAVEEEVDAAAAPNDGGEPSVWLGRDAGEPSITGDVPDSVLVVPPPEEVELVDEEPFFEDDVPHSSDPEAVEFDDVDETEEIELVAPRNAAEEAFEAELHVGTLGVPAAPAADVPLPAMAASLPVGDYLADVPDLAPESDDDGVRTIIDAAREHQAPEDVASDDAALEDATPEDAVEAALPVAFAERAAEHSVPVTAPAVAMPAPVDDSAKWEGVAEEIRMQVLQRIDIFTDTGLREQLALRLQPIVDRASADLVATINQHVGDLLRAYVAEAIEREIESWRRNH